MRSGGKTPNIRCFAHSAGSVFVISYFGIFANAYFGIYAYIHIMRSRVSIAVAGIAAIQLRICRNSVGYIIRTGICSGNGKTCGPTVTGLRLRVLQDPTADHLHRFFQITAAACFQKLLCQGMEIFKIVKIEISKAGAVLFVP